MAGKLETFWYVVTGRWPERPPGGWTVAEIQARAKKQGVATVAGCQPDELLDLVLKRSWWRTWVWPDLSVIFGRAGERFGAMGVGAAVGGPLGAGIGAVVGGWRSDREALARARAAVPEGKIILRDLATPVTTFMARILLLTAVGIALFFAALLLAVALMAFSPGMLDSIVTFFAGAQSSPRSIRQISLDLLYFNLIFNVLFMIILLLNHPVLLFRSLVYSPNIYLHLKMGGVSFYIILYIFFTPLVILVLRSIIFGKNLIDEISEYLVILMFPLVLSPFILLIPIIVIFYLMFCIRRSGKLPDWLRFET